MQKGPAQNVEYHFKKGSKFANKNKVYVKPKICICMPSVKILLQVFGRAKLLSILTPTFRQINKNSRNAT